MILQISVEIGVELPKTNCRSEFLSQNHQFQKKNVQIRAPEVKISLI
jgi:hypothetical protein